MAKDPTLSRPSKLARIPMALGLIVALGAVSTGVPASAQAVNPAAPPAGSDVGMIPVTFTSETSALPMARQCDQALLAVATGQPVPFAAAGCLRIFMLDAGSQTTAMPAPDACEALLPSLAIGEPVRLGAAVPCIETYMTPLGSRDLT